MTTTNKETNEVNVPGGVRIHDFGVPNATSRELHEERERREKNEADPYGTEAARVALEAYLATK